MHWSMMASPELLSLAESALRLPIPASIHEDLLDCALRQSGAVAARLLHEGRQIAEGGQDPAKIGKDSVWSDLELLLHGEAWTLGLLHPRQINEEFLSVTRIILQAISLQNSLKRAHFDTRFHLWELEVIRSIGANIKHLDEPEKLANELLGHLLALLGVRRAHVYFQSDDSPAAGFGEAILDSKAVSNARKKANLGETIVAVPLGSTENLGVLVVAEKEARSGIEAFAEEDRRLVELFALQMTVALEYASFARKSLERDRLERELQVAATIQRHILPQDPPELPHFEIVARSTPCLHVAGDTFDLIPQDDGLVVAITDVSGKGVGAGMIASGIHAGIRLLLGEELYLADLAARLNRYLCGATDDNRFATFGMARITHEGHLYAVNAGHCPILVKKTDGEIRKITSSGLPLGIMEINGYKTEDLLLHSGDIVLLYTDGFTEAENPKGEEFGVEQVVKTLAQSPAGARGAAEALFDGIRQYTEGHPLADDATLIAVEYRE